MSRLLWPPLPPDTRAPGPAFSLSDADRLLPPPPALPTAPALQGTPAAPCLSPQRVFHPARQQHFYLHGSCSTTSVSAEPEEGSSALWRPPASPRPRTPPETRPRAPPEALYVPGASASGRRSTPVPHPSLSDSPPDAPQHPTPPPAPSRKFAAGDAAPEAAPRRGARPDRARAPLPTSARVRPATHTSRRAPTVAARPLTLGCRSSPDTRRALLLPRLRLRAPAPAPATAPAPAPAAQPGPCPTQPRSLLPPAPNASPPASAVLFPLAAERRAPPQLAPFGSPEWAGGSSRRHAP